MVYLSRTPGICYGPRLGRNRLIINLWHGVPLKKIALMDPNLKKMSRIYFKKIFSENYTWILTTARELILYGKKFSGLWNKSVYGGSLVMILFFFLRTEKKFWGNLSSVTQLSEGDSYAPTFRDYGNTRLFPFEDFDKKAFQDFLEGADSSPSSAWHLRRLRRQKIL